MVSIVDKDVIGDNLCEWFGYYETKKAQVEIINLCLGDGDYYFVVPTMIVTGKP